MVTEAVLKRMDAGETCRGKESTGTEAGHLFLLSD
jgi:hypothetical protein